MMVLLNVRLEGGTEPHIVSHTDTPELMVHWLSGFLGGGIIVDSMKVIG